MKPFRRLQAFPGEQWARRLAVEELAERGGEGWRERVFAFLFDPSPVVRDAAAFWLCSEPEPRRLEYEIVLKDPDWEVRYHAPSGRLMDPDLQPLPEWAVELLTQALGRDRNAIVARQILLFLARRAPERFPDEIPRRIREQHGCAQAGFALGNLRLGRQQGWDLLIGMLEDDENVRGIMFALAALTGDEPPIDLRSSSAANAYLAGLERWLEVPTEYPFSKARAPGLVEALRQALVKIDPGR